MFRTRRAALALAATSALIGGLLAAPFSAAADGTGTYATWTFPTNTSGSLLINPDPAWPTASVSVTGGTASAPSGASAYLNDETPIGQVYGSSRNQTYASVGTSSTSVTTITFGTPTPASGWAFALGDVDVEDVTITASDQSGNAIDVSSWFASTFNYCVNSGTKPSTCSGKATNEPTWSSPTLSAKRTSGAVSDTAGASAWFEPDSAVKTLTLSSTDASGVISAAYQIWIASFPVPAVPTPAPQIITLDIDPNEGTCSTAKLTGEVGTWANLPGEDACTREGYEFLGFAPSADATQEQFAPGAPVNLTFDGRLFAIYKEIVPEPFLCTPDLIQVSGTGGGVLYVYDPTRNTMDLIPDGGGPDKAPGANATGYNPADDFIYGVAPNGANRHLWKFGSNGVYEDLGAIIDSGTGAPVQNLSLISGDFIADDVLLAIQTPNRMLTIDVAPTRSGQPAQATLQALPRGVWGAADIAFTSDRTVGYGISGTNLFIATLPGGDAAGQVAAVGQRSTFTRKTVLGAPTRGTYGAAYLDQNNNAYFYNNQERRIYLITTEELAKDQPRATPLGTERAFVLGTDQTLQVPTDGASCPTAPIVTVTLTYDINGGTGDTPGDQSGFVDQEVTVADGTGFEKEDAVFAGWNTAPDGSGANYTPGALFDLGASGGKLYAMWAPVEPAPPVPPENILEPVTEPEPPIDEGDEVVFTPIDDLPAPPNDPWQPSSLVLIDPDGGNPTPAVRDDSGDWSVNNRIGTVTYTPDPVFSGPAQITVQLQTESGARYQSTLQTQVPSCEVGERVRATVYFDVLSSQLDAKSRRTLNRLVREANSRGVPTCSVVVGFVQPTPNRSNDSSLSTSRAESVADYLDDRGINRIIRTEGLGRADQQGAKARRATATIYLAPPPPATPVDQ